MVASNAEGAREVDEQTIKGSAVESVHKPREGGNAHKQRQRRHAEAAYQNAADVVKGIKSAASEFRPELIVLAGEVSGREVVRTEMPKGLLEMTREIDAGSRAAGASEDALEDAFLTEVGRFATERETAIDQQFHEAKGHGNAAEGLEQVLEAARTGAIATLILVDAHPVPGELYVGDTPRGHLDAEGPGRVDLRRRARGASGRAGARPRGRRDGRRHRRAGRGCGAGRQRRRAAAVPDRFLGALRACEQ